MYMSLPHNIDQYMYFRNSNHHFPFTFLCRTDAKAAKQNNIMYNGLNKYIHCTSKKTQFQQQIISMSAI